jgi:hypothetical protein
LFLLLQGCSEEPNIQGSTSGSTATAHVVSGKVTDFAGRPLVGARVEILGHALSTGASTNSYPTTDGNGAYSVTVTPGRYSVNAFYDAPFNGKLFRYALHPADGASGQDYDSSQGIVRDFVWKVSGLRAGAETSQDNAASYYGGAATFSIGDIHSESGPQTNHFGEEFPQGFTAEITLTPDGPLIDGSTGTPIVSKHDAAFPLDAEWTQFDIPVGRYTLTGQITEPDGSTHKLQVLDIATFADITGKTPQPSGVLEFEPEQSASGGVRPVNAVLIYGPPYDPLV